MHKLQIQNQEKTFIRIGNIKIDITDKTYNNLDESTVLSQVFFEAFKSLPLCCVDISFQIMTNNTKKKNGSIYFNSKIELSFGFKHIPGGEKYPIHVIIDCLQPSSWKLQIIRLRLNVPEENYQADRKMLLEHIKAILENLSDCFKY